MEMEKGKNVNFHLLRKTTHSHCFVLSPTPVTFAHKNDIRKISYFWLHLVSFNPFGSYLRELHVLDFFFSHRNHHAVTVFLPSLPLLLLICCIKIQQFIVHEKSWLLFAICSLLYLVVSVSIWTLCTLLIIIENINFIHFYRCVTLQENEKGWDPGCNVSAELVDRRDRHERSA